MSCNTKVFCSLVGRAIGKRCFPIEKKGCALRLCQPVVFQVNVKGMSGNGDIDVFRTNGRSGLAKVSKRDARVSIYDLEEGGEFRLRNR